jgi:1-aminocyclopropane-1-carboxylate deaminase
MAQAGMQILANEIVSYWLQYGNNRPLAVSIPGGTCTTGVLLHHAIKQEQQLNPSSLDIEVVVIPCVGDASYAKRQMKFLCHCLQYPVDDIPTILNSIPNYDDDLTKPKDKQAYFAFGQPNPLLLETYRAMLDEHNIPLDLLYGAPSWAVLKSYLHRSQQEIKIFNQNTGIPFAKKELMYVHSGGVEGNASQLWRYKHRGILA